MSRTKEKRRKPLTRTSALDTTHHLDFLSREMPRTALDDICAELVACGLVVDDDPDGPPWTEFVIGTCRGAWRCTDDAYEILAIINTAPGNGHFEDVLEWFEFSCRRDGKKFRFLQLENQGFKRHLIEKRGFTDCGVNVEIH